MGDVDSRLVTPRRRDSRSLSLAQPVCCPAGCFLSRADVDAVAEEWAARAAQRERPDWLAEFLVSLDGDVRPSPDPKSLLLVAERLDCFVATGTNLWALSEALGHLVLHLGHCDVPDGHPADEPVMLAVPAAIAGRGPYARARLEAVWFALAFLTPAPRFRDAWSRHGGSDRKVAGELCLPVTIIHTRAINLGLLPEGPRSPRPGAGPVSRD
jgi:hypothetical protein